MPIPFRISLTFYFLTQLSSGASGSAAVMADKVVVRNGLGEYIVPGSQIRGTLRHACERLLRGLGNEDRICDGPRPERMCPHADKSTIPHISDPFDQEQTIHCCPLCTVFGSPYFPSPIQFHDLVCENPLRKAGEQPYTTLHDARLGKETLRPMVSLNRRRGVAEPQRLFFIETTPSQPSLAFTNQQAVVGMLDNEVQAKLLLAGLRLITALGGGRSRGFGWSRVDEQAWLGEQRVTPGGWEDLQKLWHSSE